MKLCNQFISRPFRFSALLIGVGLSLYGCCSLQTDGVFAKDKAAMLLDLDVKTTSHALTSLRETPSYSAPGQKRPAAMLLDIDSGGVKGEKSTPISIREQAPAEIVR